jgi:hypothetical protein
MASHTSQNNLYNGRYDGRIFSGNFGNLDIFGPIRHGYNTDFLVPLGGRCRLSYTDDRSATVLVEPLQVPDVQTMDHPATPIRQTWYKEVPLSFVWRPLGYKDGGRCRHALVK